MKETKRIMFALLMFACLVALAFAVSAQESSPQLPHLFYGTSQINGGDAPAGTGIIARVNGEEKGRIITGETGKYGGSSANEKKLLVQGSIEDGANVEFYVSTIKAGQTASFNSGEVEELNLTWNFPDEIVLEEDSIANEPILCLPGTNMQINIGDLTVSVTCSETSTANINNITNLGGDFLIGAPSPEGVQNISNVVEISITGDIDIIVTLTYDDAGIDESTIRPYKHVNGLWTVIPDSDIISIDTTANAITFKVSPGGTPYTAFGSSPAPPSTGGGGGGGGAAGAGGGLVQAQCTYDWQCTGWSECAPAGTQTRTCTNFGTCLDNAGKPAEVQDCVYTAPEVEEETPTAQIATPLPLTPEEEAPTPGPGGLAAITGAIISAVGKTPPAVAAIAFIVIVIFGGFAVYVRFIRRK